MKDHRFSSSLPPVESDPSGQVVEYVNDPEQIRPRPELDENRLLSIVGAVGIGQQLVSEGFAAVLLFFVGLNISLGLLNLLPLLPFDGGHMAVATYERLRSFGGRQHRVDAARLLPVTYAVVALMLVVGGLAIIRDIGLHSKAKTCEPCRSRWRSMIERATSFMTTSR